jgi:organic radical activating enzyme
MFQKTGGATMKLRLLITEKCNRNCKWCNNQHWELRSLPVETKFNQYSEVMLTGGEPMLYPKYVIQTSKAIRKQSNAKIYLYTAKIDSPLNILAVLHFIDGLSVTPHSEKDVSDFVVLNNFIIDSGLKKSLKLNNFTDYGFDLSAIDLSMWRVKDKAWLKEKHLPKNETFKRVQQLLPPDEWC